MEGSIILQFSFTTLFIQFILSARQKLADKGSSGHRRKGGSVTLAMFALSQSMHVDA